LAAGIEDVFNKEEAVKRMERREGMEGHGGIQVPTLLHARTKSDV